MSLRKSPREVAPADETGGIAPPAAVAKDQAISEQAPMTAAQAAELKGLAEEGLEPDAFDPSLTELEASKRIKALRAKLRLMSEPPHTV
ncbi:MAG: DUF3072 domain-containing protein [Xanthobacteraceae bacterium]